MSLRFTGINSSKNYSTEIQNTMLLNCDTTDAWTPRTLFQKLVLRRTQAGTAFQNLIFLLSV
jgi:hypothetical protein